MRLFGFDITKAKPKGGLRPAEDRGWMTIMRETFAGAFQQNVTVDFDSVMSNHAVFACQTLIASDCAKLRVKLIQLEKGVWVEADNSAYSPVLRKPNHYQTRVQYWESYFLSKLSRGNVYILKQRDDRNVVIAKYVLDPNRVTPLVSDDGSVFYRIESDSLSGVAADAVIAPASEIIHDRFNCIFHPLIGISPIMACGLAAMQAQNIQNNSARLFANLAIPSGILTAPGSIGSETASRLKESWQTNYGGENRGKIAVLGDGLKFEKMTLTAAESQMIEQLKLSAEIVCSAFHVPPYKVGVGALPSYNNVQALNVEYYSQCLQAHLEAAEVCLDEALGLAPHLGVEFDLDGLLRMDSVTQMDVVDKGIKAGVLAPNEGRAQFGRKPVAGGDTPYLQQQNFSLAALQKRDAKDDPFKGEEPVLPAPPPTDDIDADDMQAESEKRFRAALMPARSPLLLTGPMA